MIPQTVRNDAKWLQNLRRDVILDRDMTVPVEYVDVQQLLDEEEEARPADVEALREQSVADA